MARECLRAAGDLTEFMIPNYTLLSTKPETAAAAVVCRSTFRKTNASNRRTNKKGERREKNYTHARGKYEEARIQPLHSAFSTLLLILLLRRRPTLKARLRSAHTHRTRERASRPIRRQNKEERRAAAAPFLAYYSTECAGAEGGSVQCS